MWFRLSWLWVCMALGAATAPAPARTWIVDAEGGGDFTRIAEACLAAGSGDTVAVEPGEYDEYDGHANTGIVSKPLTLLGRGTAPGDVRARISLVFVSCNPVIIEGITFHDEHLALAFDGECGVVVRNCRFEDNSAWYDSAGALFYSGGTPATIEDCTFVRNKSLCTDCNAGALLLAGTGHIVRRCVFEENEAVAHGGAIWGDSEWTLENCLFVGNKAENGAAVTTHRGTEITGCTFYANETTWFEGAALEMTWQGTEAVERCIVAGTINGYGIGCWGVVYPRCFCFWNNERGSVAGDCDLLPTGGNFEADPLFCDPAVGNFRLQDDSPCLPGEHGGAQCGLIGAYDAGCVVSPTVETTWGKVKAGFWTPE